MALQKLQCVCGEFVSLLWAVVNKIPIVECTCGIRRVEFIDPDKYTALYTSGKYHSEGSEDLPHDSSSDDAHRAAHRQRFVADVEVAKNRFAKLSRYVPCGGSVLIDVGCANGAFMDVALSSFTTCYGVDLSSDAVPDALKDRVRVGDLRYVGFQRRSADVITFNDSFEHFVNPLSALKAARGILMRDGILAIEIPDMSSKDALENGPDFKHVKPHEHLWYFTAAQLRDLLETNGFTVVGMDAPIPGKVTVYASPSATVEEISIYGPPGIGDIIWTLNKVEPIRIKEWPCRIKYVVCVEGETKQSTRAKDFLQLCRYVDSVEFRSIALPVDKGCPDPSVPDYYLLANDYLDPKTPPYKGGLIENWHPELESWFDVGIEIPSAAVAQVFYRIPNETKYVTFYLSSHIWNRITTRPVWTPDDWASVILTVTDSGLKPVILGAGWDANYAQDVADCIARRGREPTKVWINMIGKTPIALALAFMKFAECTVGIAAGLPILAGYFGWPTIILWPVAGESPVEAANGAFCAEFTYNWLPPAVRNSTSYKALSVGHFTADDLTQAILRKANRANAGQGV